MDIRELLIGLGFLVVGIFALWVALPRDGQVRGFLRSDAVQSYYAVVVLGIIAVGLVNIVRGFVPG